MSVFGYEYAEYDDEITEYILGTRVWRCIGDVLPNWGTKQKTINISEQCETNDVHGAGSSPTHNSNGKKNKKKEIRKTEIIRNYFVELNGFLIEDSHRRLNGGNS